MRALIRTFLVRIFQKESIARGAMARASQQRPHSISRFEHTAFSYRPGEPLENYRLAFDHKPGTGHDDDFEVVHQAYQLRKSACFRKSQMTCLTCHDPHIQLRGEEATKHYIAICISCHVKAHAAGFPSEDGIATRTSTTGPNCLTCHMWKRRTSDAVHVVMTDHYIQRQRPKEDPLAPKMQGSSYYSGEVVPYYPTSLDRIPNGALYLAIAQTEDDSNLAAGAEQLKDAINKIRPADDEFYFAMGAADSKLGKNTEAIQWYKEALRRRPDYQQALRALASTCEALGDLPRAAEVGEKAANTAHPDTSVLADLGGVYLKLGRLDDAKRVLEQALAIDPNLPNAALLLGMVAMREGDTARAESQYRFAIASEPDLAEPHNNLAGILARRGNYAEAVYEYEKAIQDDPANAEVRLNYSIVLAHTGALEKAAVEAREAVRLEPKSAPLHANLGDVFMKNGEEDAAEREYRTALALDQENGDANLKLADLLIKKGAVLEARKYYEAAARSSDSRVRGAASNALQRQDLH
jgi:Tfp pilus assembly protein PilF